MNIRIDIKEQSENAASAFVIGEIDAYTAPKLKEALEVFQDKSHFSLKVDLTEVGYMDSTGLGVFVGLFKNLRTNESELILVGLSERLYRLFEITGLSDIIEIKNIEGEMNGNNV
ncbi:anti-anti-sigma factor (antagonist of RsbW) [Listeria fleischmannii 1991]|uniref:Anti-sigma factor antagonist n=2 Tax=Listeria fleischmannii TaxID=1069827 RepID=A0A2X3GV36_9LIST|nr:STAS domain-containing protein [Listeria fleischmannii]EMG26866.1 anti-anti-sigma factor (antagonist of RsbW) [Listeria fleischmannii subsp. fleischmannii LU2006-1]KMT58977.1 anti-anti-sigma factor (antagonist of RsbW) [Listeria fleischmannii 1991]SQC72132.1 Anti-anti-sigma-B factor [Listeria fleischmannii subsp. fleischmannii]